MKNKRPIGLIILGLILIIIGLLGIDYILKAPNIIKTVPKLILWVFWTASFLVAGVGILSLREWARILAIVLIAVKTVQVISGSIKDTRTLINISADPISIYVVIGMTVFILLTGGYAIYYLSTSRIKNLFKY